MKDFQEKICPNCGSRKLKQWENLTEDEKFLVERLPSSAEFSTQERKNHRFCVRCWFEDSEKMESKT